MAEVQRKELKECQDKYRKNAETEGTRHEADYASDDSDAVFAQTLSNGIPAQVAVPSQQLVAEMLLAKKKEALLDRFA
jgi:hypothetical protein